ncbi:hypothetical protein, partial [Methanoculleus sp.]|uniref:hypothetical protein n=1 Tax=Methanoculleus sp. TaxID=90427 RepID=UPI002BE75D22
AAGRTLPNQPPGEPAITMIDKVRQEIELVVPGQKLIIYTSDTIMWVRALPTFFLWHGRPAGNARHLLSLS